MIQNNYCKFYLARIFVVVLFVSLACNSPRASRSPANPSPTTLSASQIRATSTVPAPTTLPEATKTPPPTPPATNTPLPPSPTVSPTATPTPSLRFAVIGDYGLAGQPEADVAALIKSWEVDLIITTGDNNYPDGAAETIDENVGQYYHSYIAPYTGEYAQGADENRFFPTLGNHDWTAPGAQPYLDYFTLPGNERYYDFVREPVHFFAIDSDSREPDGVGRSSVQAQWLKEKLANSESIWKVVYMHQPPYSSSQDGSIAWAQWPYKEWGASIVLAGHSHVYERIEVNGFPYIINGLGGGPIYGFDEPISGSQVRFNADYGAMLVEATTELITFQFITRAGQVVDTYTLQAGGS